MKKILAAALVIALIFALCVPAYAANKDNVQQYAVYTSFGDSIPGCAVWLGFSDLNFDEKEGTYPALVKEYLGAKHNSLSYGGFTTRELRYMLDPTYELDDWAFTCTGKKCKPAIDGMRDYINQSVKEADVITINIGANDIFSVSVIKALYSLSDAPSVETGIEDLDSSLNTMLTVSTALDALYKAVEEDYLLFYNNMSAILRMIKDANDKAEILLVGIYNPIEGFPLNSDSEVELGNLFAMFTERTNTATEYFAKLYGCTYVDINGTPTELHENYTSLSDDGFLNSFLADMHPSRTGHKYIADKILEVLPERKDCTIELDVSDIKDVDCVYLDGVKYPAEVKNGVATVKCENKDFETAAVYGYRTGALSKLYAQKIWTLNNNNGTFAATYVPSYKNACLYAKVNAQVLAGYGRAVIYGK